MTREEKKIKRQSRKHSRCEKRRDKNKAFNVLINKWVHQHDVSKQEARHYYKYNCFLRDNTYMQLCSWLGVCKFPCDGSC